MVKKNRPPQSRPQSNPSAAGSGADKPATLKDLLNADVLQKLKQSAEDMRAEEARQREAKRKQEEDARKAEQKRLENDFSHLLANDKTDWRKFK